MDFIAELQWRGMLQDSTPEIAAFLKAKQRKAYIGIDPTADSLHIGHLASVMLLKHFQRAGHQPIVLLGGATGMIGDPSGKSAERNLLDESVIRKNEKGIQEQVSRFIDFNDTEAPAELFNNYDWMHEFSFLGFLREVGKHISISYMMAKDSVKKRLETGLSFTEFSYQLVQAYDFLHLYENAGCSLQMGGSDQWGNITTGTELIRRKNGGEAHALTMPLITKADGTKFGKTESGTVWLDAERTSPYEFYQFWFNTSDEDAEKYIKIFTFLNQEEVSELVNSHREAPHLRVLQKTLAEKVTTFVHGETALKEALKASSILFGKSTSEDLKSLGEKSFLSALKGVPQFHIKAEQLTSGIPILDFLAVETAILPSKSEARKLIKGNAISINKNKIQSVETTVNQDQLLNERYLLVQKGKKNYFLVVLE